MKITNTKEVMIEIEKYLKAGRLSFSVLSWDLRNNSVINELIVKYDEADGKPMLYIKNPDGQIVPIITESDANLKEFIENFIEVSVDRTKDYEPSMWFMLRKDGSGNTGFNQSVIDQFNSYINDNFDELKPYMLQVFKDGKRELLVPYVDTKSVFYDLGKLIQDERVRNFDDIITLLYNLIIDIRENLVDIMNAVETKFNDMNEKLILENERQNKEITDLESHMDDSDSKLNSLLGELGDIRGTTERRLLQKEISVGGEANKIYPVRLKYTGGGLPISGGVEMFMGAMFLTMENSQRNIVLQIGNNHMTTSPSYYIGTSDQYYTYTHKVLNGNNAKHYVYAVKQVGSGDHILMLRGATRYTLWTKYPEFVTITNNLGTIATPNGDFSPIPDTNKTLNPYLTDDNILGVDACRTFVNTVHVVNSVIIGNNMRMSIE